MVEGIVMIFLSGHSCTPPSRKISEKMWEFFFVAKTKILYYFIPLAPASQRILQKLGLLVTGSTFKKSATFPVSYLLT